MIHFEISTVNRYIKGGIILTDKKTDFAADLFHIYISSLKVGALTFGGGYAMLPILQREVVERRKWNAEEEILDFYALAQCLPGIIMVNTLSMVGHKRRGRPGALAASFGAITPSIVIILAIATLLTAFADVPAVQNAFAGIRVCVCVLIFNSIIKLWKSSVVNKISLAILISVATGSLFLNLSPIFFVVAAATVGILVTFLKRETVGNTDDSPESGKSE